MSAKNKVFLIVILAATACLLIFILSRYYSNKNNANQILLIRIQNLSVIVEHTCLFGENFIQTGKEADWQKINQNLERIHSHLEAAVRINGKWRGQIQALEKSVSSYRRILANLHEPVARLMMEKANLQKLEQSLSKEVKQRIVTPYLEEAALRPSDGKHIDPSREKLQDKTNDMIGLYIKQKLVMFELLLEWDLPAYQNKSENLAKALEQHKTQLRRINMLLESEPRFRSSINPIRQEFADLVHSEDVILNLFSDLATRNENLASTGNELLNATQGLSSRVISDTSDLTRLNRILNWGQLVVILGILGLLGSMLATDIVHFVEELKKSREEVTASESNLRVTLRSIGDAVIATDDKAMVTRINPAAQALTGWLSAEAIGKPLPEVFHIIHTQSRTLLANPVEKVLSEGKTIGLANHTTLVARDGNEYQIADSGAPIRGADGQIIGVVLVFRDVTESYAQEQKIRDSEKHLKDLTVNVPGLVYQLKVTREHGYISEFISEKAHEIFGLQAERKSFFNEFYAHIPEGEKDGFISSLHEAADSKSTWNYEGRYTKPSGQTIRFSTKAIPRLNGDTVVFYGVMMDVTWRRQLEKSLRLTQYCVDTVSIGILWVGKNGRIFSVNQEACRSLGYSRNELCAMTAFDIDPNLNRDAFNDRFDELRRYKTCTIQTLHKHKSGKVFPVEVLINLVSFEGQEFFVVFVRDTTEKKQAEETLRTAHETFFTVLNSMDASVHVSDMETHEILFVNECMRKKFGRDMTGEKCWTALRGESGPCASCNNGQLVDSAGKPTGVHAGQTRNPVDGRWYINHIRAIEWIDGRIVKLRIDLDITDRKKMEEQLNQAKKMETIGTLAGGIAHDFNNILSAIVGNTQLALFETDEKDRRHRNLQQIYSAAMRATDLVSQILTFSRQTEQKVRPLRVAPLIKEALKLLRATLPTTIEIEQKISTGTDNVMADPTQIHQIIMNLCTNAAHAMEESGGRLAVGLEQVVLAAKDLKKNPGMKAGDYLRLTVQDTGQGIAPEMLGSIYDPYYTTKEIGKGTGLGLSVVHGIVRSYGGGIYVNSRLDHGTTFEIYLPVVNGQDEIEYEEHNELPGGRETILLVDDEQMLTDVGRQILEKLGYKVMAFTDSEEALAQFNKSPHEIDLVISDMTMPKITGDKLAIRILRIRPDLPVILCTGFNNKFTDKEAAQIGVKAMVKKPIAFNNLANLITKIMGEARN